MDASALDRAAIAAAHARIAPHIRRTPTLEADGADFVLDGVHLVFKLEFLQHAGSSRPAARSTTCCSGRFRRSA